MLVFESGRLGPLGVRWMEESLIRYLTRIELDERTNRVLNESRTVVAFVREVEEAQDEHELSLLSLLEMVYVIEMM